VAACPKLTELTVIWPNLIPVQNTTPEYGFDQVGRARSATSELVDACKALPDFDTFQIIHGYGSIYQSVDFDVRRQKLEGRGYVDGVRDLAINCLKGRETGYREGEGRKKTMVRVIERVGGSLYPIFKLDSVRVEEYEV
jgi:hypothetical protein